jgi:hypothetical protein
VTALEQLFPWMPGCRSVVVSMLSVAIQGFQEPRVASVDQRAHAAKDCRKRCADFMAQPIWRAR